MFKELFNKNGYKYDYQYDWVVLAEKKEKVERSNLEKMKDENGSDHGFKSWNSWSIYIQLNLKICSIKFIFIHLVLGHASMLADSKDVGEVECQMLGLKLYNI